MKSPFSFSEQVVKTYHKTGDVFAIIEEHNPGKTINLDSTLHKTRVDFIRIDVSGRELQTLSGLRKVFIDNPNVKLLISHNPRLQKAVGHNTEELISFLSYLGFEVYLLDEQKRKFYRLLDNVYSFTELLGNNLQGNLLCINKKTSLLVSYFSHMADMSGAEKSLIAQIENLNKIDVLSHCVLPHEGIFKDRLTALSASVDIVPFRWWGNIKTPTIEHMAESLKAIILYRQELEKINPHVIYTNTITVPWGAVLAYLLHKPHIWHIKEFGIKDHGFKFVVDFDAIKKTIAQLSDLVIFNSSAVEKEFKRNLHNKINGKMLYYNIQISENDLQQSTKSLYKHVDTLKLILVGSILKSKGQLDAVMAVKELNERNIPVELVILGKLNEKSAYYKQILQTINTYKLTNIYLVDKVENPYPFMKQTHILLVCSQMEAFGKTTVEGMLLKKLVIGADTGGTKELITDGKNGYVYKYGSKHDLVEKIIKIHNNRQLILTVGREAQKYALTTFSQNSYTDDIFNLLLKYKLTKSSSKDEMAGYIAQLLKYFANETLKTKNTSFVPTASQSEFKEVLKQLKWYD